MELHTFHFIWLLLHPRHTYGASVKGVVCASVDRMEVHYHGWKYVWDREIIFKHTRSVLHIVHLKKVNLGPKSCITEHIYHNISLCSNPFLYWLAGVHSVAFHMRSTPNMEDIARIGRRVS